MGAMPMGAARPEARLSNFILANREQILVEWEAFAKTCSPSGDGLSVISLRDHASAMLSVIAADLNTPQSGSQQLEKSMGRAPTDEGGPDTAAEEHGADRAESGFSIDSMIAEFRALRASVVRLWTLQPQGGVHALEDLTRFNEAIDQALTESVTRFSADLERSKDMFVAILAHDLRTPLGAISTAATFMLDTNDLEEPHLTLTKRIGSSSHRMVGMIGDLLDFTRSRLGGGIIIERAPMSMTKVVRDIAEEVAIGRSTQAILINAPSDERGEWDGGRIGQALANLIGNAVEHGAGGTDVTVALDGDREEVRIAIHNEGRPIPRNRIGSIFSPMKGSAGIGNGPRANLGLGLYIADRIVDAHGGRVRVSSSESAGTTFTVHLPRDGRVTR
jgi:signal transduction histidine kinase